jgi:DNA-binding LacI/PurR family transcriptional regulator
VGYCHNDVTGRALRRLSEAGFSRIAMLGYHSASNSIEPQRDAYDRAADALGLQYRRCELIRMGDLNTGASVRQLLGPGKRPDAIYLSDEFLAPALIEAAHALDLALGRDLGLVCFSNRGINVLPEAWSRLEIDIRLAGQLAVEALIRSVETGEEYPGNLILQPRWRPARTHLIPDVDAADVKVSRQNA